MMGDAISHAVLPGIAIAFLLTQSRSSLPMFIGAALAGILTAVLSEYVHRRVKVDEGAGLGAIFSVLFAIGLIAIVRGADAVDLDPSCVLYGAIELTPLDRITLLGVTVPRALIRLIAIMVLNLVVISLFYKELNLSSFDPALAASLGINANFMHYLLMAMVAITAVTVFELVGSILVIAMLIVPPATAYLLTTRLKSMIALSAGLAVAIAVIGHLAAISIPPLFGFKDTTTAGAMAAVAGLLFIPALLFARNGGLLRQREDRGKGLDSDRAANRGRRSAGRLVLSH